MAKTRILKLDDVFSLNPGEWLTTINTEKETIYKRNNEILCTTVIKNTNCNQECIPFTSSPQYIDINSLLQSKIHKKHFINSETNTAFENVIFQGRIKDIDTFNNKYYLKVEDNDGIITVIVDHNYIKNNTDTDKPLVNLISDEIFHKLNINTAGTTNIFQCPNPKIEDVEVNDNIIINGKMKEWSQNRYIFANSIIAYQIQ